MSPFKDDEGKDCLGKGRSTQVLFRPYMALGEWGTPFATQNGVVITKDWIPVPIESAPPEFGVPTDRTEHGYFSYEAAQALRWWAHALFRHSSIKTKLEKVTISETWYIKPEGSVDEITSPDFRQLEVSPKACDVAPEGRV